MKTVFEQINDAVCWLNKKKKIFSAEVGVVLGSGLGDIINDVNEKVIISYNEVPGMPKSTVAGHKGNFIFGILENKKVVIMQGRIHFYEGYSLQEVTIPIRIMKKLGIKNLILTSAVGGIRGRLPLKPGDIVLIKDHINNIKDNPLIGPHNEEFGVRFPDMSEVYSKQLRQLAKKVANKFKIKVYEGIYNASCGPSYETPAEVQAFKKLGADVVGMSVVPESIVANQSGIKVLGISYVSNLAAGISKTVLTHEEVLENAKKVASKLNLLVKEIIKKL